MSSRPMWVIFDDFFHLNTVSRDRREDAAVASVKVPCDFCMSHGRVVIAEYDGRTTFGRLYVLRALCQVRYATRSD